MKSRRVSRLERYGDSASRPDLRAVIDQLAAALNAKQAAYPARLSSRVGDRVQIIDVARITHFFGRDKLTYAVAGGKDLVVDYSITELEAKLDARQFVRIHRAILLKVDYVDEVHAWLGGGLRVRLKDNKRTELSVARDRVKLLKERWGSEVSKVRRVNDGRH